MAARGALAGAGAGLVCALGDFGASFLWLPIVTEQLAFLLRLVATMVPLGAALGAAVGAYGAVTSRWLAGRKNARRVWPLPFVALVAPGAAAVAHLLFTGGKMSRLPARDALVVLVALVLLAGTYCALRVGRLVVVRALEGTRGRGIATGIAVLAAYVAVSKLDQHVLPNLYAYLHGVLALAGFVLAAFAILLLGAHIPRLGALARMSPARGAVLVMAAVAVFTLDLFTLDHNQNVRVALFDTRASTSRSLMFALEPLLDRGATTGASQAAIERARDARQRRTALTEGGALPTWDGAHVLFITVDALRPDHLGTYGYERDTSPAIDALAAEAVVFERAYAAAPHSSYSLCSVMTSEYLHEAVDLGQPLPEITLPLALGSDYHTAAFYTLGIFHTEGERLERYRDDAFGFARHDHSNVDASERTDLVLAEVDRVAGMGEPPSFFWIHYFDVHEPYRDTRFGTSDVDRYDGEIRKVDGEVERLLAGVRARFARDVIVVLSADHGEEFRDHGGLYHGSTLYEEQIRVPLIVHAPDLPARRVTAPVELVDLAPTLLGMVDRPVPSTMRGDDLRPLALGRVDDLGPAFAGVTYKRMVVRWPHKLVADLRFNLFQLYDLSADPRERTNLASREPALLEELKGEVYAWIDTLSAPPGGGSADPRVLAIDRGRLRDRRAVEPLGELVEDETAPIEMRLEAARILGQLADTRAAPHLTRSMRAPEPLVAAEAAVALGRMYDERARSRLRELVHSEDPDLRVRAAVSLGRLRDREAVPALIEALWIAPSSYERQEAVRWLGRLRDERAVEPLLALIPEFRIRDLSVIALGSIGDPRAYDPLIEMLDWEHHTSIRDNVVRGLGLLGDRRAVPRLAAVAASEDELENIGESLVRLGAIESGHVGGADVRPGLRGARGFGACHEGPLLHDWNYRQRTWCETARSRASIPLRVPDAIRGDAEGALALVRARRVDAATPVLVTLTVGDTSYDTVAVDGEWNEHRFPITREMLHTGRVVATLEVADAGARVRLDHLLLVGRPAQIAAVEQPPSP